MALELLKAAARAAHGEAGAGIEPGLLRFSLEYSQAPRLETATQQVADLLGADGFVLRRPPFSDDPNLLLLEFPGVGRAQSARFLFATAHELVDALGLDSATPDVDPGWSNGDELGRDLPESVGGIIGRFCDSDAPPPPDRRWAIAAVRADRAWARFGAYGRGILIGQPDTGVADHRELDEGLDRAKGIDILAGGGAPVDPLTQQGGNPGHGTATAGCAVSRQPGMICGVAPQATLVPIRCVDSVVIGSGASVAAAIDHARRAGCHIVTMSLGGPVEMADLRRAIARAVAADMIVMAAAGNCVGMVVYPAWDENVIAVAGVDVQDRRWRGSSRGRKIDVAAPCENVYVARRTRPDDLDKGLVSPGQGTSFAVATTAGCAALWLGHHKVAAVRAAAAAAGASVQELFRAALRRSARRPADWPDSMGAGIVDAEALLALDLAAILPAAAPASGHPLRATLGDGFDWGRFGAEAGLLAFDRRQRAEPERAMAMESPVAPRPSPALAAALRDAGRDPDEMFGAPSVRSPLTPELSPGRALRLVASGAGGAPAIEGGAGLEVAAARSYLAGEGGAALSGRLEAALGAHAPPADAGADVVALRDRLLAAAPAVVEALAAGARPEQLAPVEQMSLEAIVRLTGRPALRIVDGQIDPQDPEVGDWFTDLWGQRDLLRPLFDAVGRIDLEADGRWIHYGTGTVVAPGVVMTNRHVVDALAEPIPAPGGGTTFLLAGPVTIAFDETATLPQRRFEIERVIAAGPDRIGGTADVRRLDLALLAMKPVNALGGAAPAPVPLAALAAGERPRLAVVGYPARPGQSSVIDPATGAARLDAWERLWAIYQNRFGEKYVSPGEVEMALGALPGDPRGWAFSHDATTLPGNSGSTVIGLDGCRAFGLHFGGAPLRQNLGHGLGAVRAAAQAGGVIDPAVFDAMDWA